jgi:acyl-CoA thioesterase-1
MLVLMRCGSNVAIRGFLLLFLATFATTATTGRAFAAPLRVVAFGDSLTAGYGVAQKDAFPVKLQAALVARGLDVEIANAGVSGDTTDSGLARLDWSIPEGTEAVLLELGANDMLRGQDPASTARALDDIMARLKARGIKVMILGMRAAPNLGPDYQKAYDAIFPDLAQKYGAPLYPFFLDGVAGDRGLNQPDGLHPTAAGVDRIVARIAPAVEAFLKGIRP